MGWGISETGGIGQSFKKLVHELKKRGRAVIKKAPEIEGELIYWGQEGGGKVLSISDREKLVEKEVRKEKG